MNNRPQSFYYTPKVELRPGTCPSLDAKKIEQANEYLLLALLMVSMPPSTASQRGCCGWKQSSNHGRFTEAVSRGVGLPRIVPGSRRPARAGSCSMLRVVVGQKNRQR